MTKATAVDGNEIFLCCKPCSEANKDDFGVRLASRPWGGFYQHEAPTKTLDAWLWQHRNCGEGDHFKLGYRHAPNHDAKKPQPEVEKAISLVLNS